MPRPTRSDGFESGHRPTVAPLLRDQVAARLSKSQSADGTWLWSHLADPLRMGVQLESASGARKFPDMAPRVDMTRLLPVMPHAAFNGDGMQAPRASGALVVMESMTLEPAREHREAGVHEFRAVAGDIDNSIHMGASRSSGPEAHFSRLLWGVAGVAGLAATVLIWRM